MLTSRGRLAGQSHHRALRSSKNFDPLTRGRRRDPNLSQAALPKADADRAGERARGPVARRARKLDPTEVRGWCGHAALRQDMCPRPGRGRVARLGLASGRTAGGRWRIGVAFAGCGRCVVG
ncbi:unnamed protein product [Ostreobium quekettii]|uniref:Uncharacterized protein n=1 Tax=Ostreobium quekettii TaxID=121088 RepID=A0A8S1IQ81_9CHLO|nr:unnamed protein product [Ostreobium quekettii]